MPLPAAVAAAAPWVLSAIGTALPAIVDAMRGSPTPEEAQAKVKPEYDALIARLVGGGMSQGEAEASAKEQLAPALEKAKQQEPMNPILSMGLALLGGIGGYKAGAGLAGKMRPKAAPPAQVADTKPDVIPEKAPEGMTQHPFPIGPASPTQRGALDDLHTRKGFENDLNSYGAFSRHRPKALDSVVEGERYDRMLQRERPVSGRSQDALEGMAGAKRFEDMVAMENPKSGHAQDFLSDMVEGQRFEHMMQDESTGYAAMEAAKKMNLPFPVRRRA